MGCPLCKDQQVPTSSSGFNAFLRKPTSLRSSRPMATNTIAEQQNCKLEFQQQEQQQQSVSEEPPIYFLSGNPALRPKTPPKKAPRTSGWKDATLRAAVAAEEASEPSRPPRRRQVKKMSQQQQIIRTTSNSLMPPQKSNKSQEFQRSVSSDTMQLELPIETAKQLEEYLRRNHSTTSLNVLLSALQAQSQDNYSSEDEDQQWSPTCLDMSDRPLSPPPPNIPIRKGRSVENTPPSYPPPPPPLEDTESEHDSFTGNWEEEQCDLPLRQRSTKLPTPTLNKSPTLTPNRLTPINLTSLPTDESISHPSTPGPWFDRGAHGLPALPRYSPSKLVVNRSSSSIQEELPSQVTPPPSLMDEDVQEVDDTMPPEITHSILLKILQQCSDDFGHNKLFSRRASVIPNNIPIEGLHEFIKTMQQHDENDEVDSNSPSIGELQSALANLLEEEKVKEKEVQIEQKIETVKPLKG